MLKFQKYNIKSDNHETLKFPNFDKIEKCLNFVSLTFKNSCTRSVSLDFTENYTDIHLTFIE